MDTKTIGPISIQVVTVQTHTLTHTTKMAIKT